MFHNFKLLLLKKEYLSPSQRCLEQLGVKGPTGKTEYIKSMLFTWHTALSLMQIEDGGNKLSMQSNYYEKI